MALAIAFRAAETSLSPRLTGLLLRAPWTVHPSTAAARGLDLPSMRTYVDPLGLRTADALRMAYENYCPAPRPAEERWTSPLLSSPSFPPPSSSSTSSTSSISPLSSSSGGSINQDHRSRKASGGGAGGGGGGGGGGDDLRTLPRTYVQLCGLDVAHSEGVELVRRLRSSGVEVRVDEFAGMPAEFWGLPRIEGAGEAVRRLVCAMTWFEQKGGWAGSGGPKEDLGSWGDAKVGRDEWEVREEEEIEWGRVEGRSAWEKRKLCRWDGCGCFM